MPSSNPRFEHFFFTCGQNLLAFFLNAIIKALKSDWRNRKIQMCRKCWWKWEEATRGDQHKNPLLHFHYQTRKLSATEKGGGKAQKKIAAAAFSTRLNFLCPDGPEKWRMGREMTAGGIRTGIGFPGEFNKSGGGGKMWKKWERRSPSSMLCQCCSVRNLLPPLLHQSFILFTPRENYGHGSTSNLFIVFIVNMFPMLSLFFFAFFHHRYRRWKEEEAY